MKRAALWLCLLAWIPVQARAAWDRSAIPSPLREMIHTRAAEVPPFPHEDSTLIDRQAWPPFINLIGKRFALSIVVRDKDGVGSRRSLAEVPAGTALALSYVNAEGPGDLLAGPSYSWDESGRLVNRVWYEPDTVSYRASRYSTYSSGKLSEYELSTRRQWPGPDDTLAVLTECFEEGGALAGFSYDLYRGGKKDSQWWWGGAPVTARAWVAYRKALFSSLHDEAEHSSERKN